MPGQRPGRQTALFRRRIAAAGEQQATPNFAGKFCAIVELNATRYELALRQLLPHLRCISLSGRNCGSGA